MLDEQKYVPEEELNFPPGTFTRVRGIQTNSATSTDVMFENVIKNMKLKLPMFESLVEYNKVKGKDKKIALIGGGPSLKNNLDELREFKTTIACGSVHDYLITKGIIPTYAANCDPSPVCANYYSKPDSEVKYLIASNADAKVIEALKDTQLIMWHCHSEELQERMINLSRETYKTDYQAVGGGCTIGLRGISLAMCMGYTNIHFFGFDSCMGEDGTQHHAYAWSDPEESKLIEKVHRIQLGPESGPTSKAYYVAGYQLAQLENFKEFYCNHHAYFNPTFHGGGALSDYYDLITQLATKKEQVT